jgi:hypothetical protein
VRPPSSNSAQKVSGKSASTRVPVSSRHRSTRFTGFAPASSSGTQTSAVGVPSGPGRRVPAQHVAFLAPGDEHRRPVRRDGRRDRLDTDPVAFQRLTDGLTRCGIPSEHLPGMARPCDQNPPAGQGCRSNIPDRVRLLPGRRRVSGTGDDINAAMPLSPAPVRMTRPSGTGATALPYMQNVPSSHRQSASPITSPVRASNRRATPYLAHSKMIWPPGMTTGHTCGRTMPGFTAKHGRRVWHAVLVMRCRKDDAA